MPLKIKPNHLNLSEAESFVYECSVSLLLQNSGHDRLLLCGRSGILWSDRSAGSRHGGLRRRKHRARHAGREPPSSPSTAGLDESNDRIGDSLHVHCFAYARNVTYVFMWSRWPGTGNRRHIWRQRSDLNTRDRRCQGNIRCLDSRLTGKPTIHICFLSTKDSNLKKYLISSIFLICWSVPFKNWVTQNHII